MDEQRKNIRYLHALGYHAAFKRKDILTGATQWTNAEDITLREISRSQQYKHGMIPSREVLRTVRFIETDKGMWVPRAEKRGE